MPASHPRAPQRVRNELRFRHITVASKTLVAGVFWRIEFTGSDLAGFNSPAFDDHIKVFFPENAGGELALPQMTEEGIIWPNGVRPAARDYTPLKFNGSDSLTLDFYIHDGGVASSWAAAAQPGDRIAMGGPRGSCIAPVDYACQIYVCDETGLPAFMRRYAEMQAQTVHLLAFADESTGRDYLGELPNVTVSWLGSGAMQADNLAPLIAQLEQITLPPDEYFIWLTGEGEAVKQLSDYFTRHRGAHSDFVRAVAYWHQK
ncbi:NADPH-dependent ferric siderophore reductase [Pantoea wallisii]|uniref:NADPH-dependent ferric siderophore reductase n=1 Tax=Pantoea wallisii TaxID=1076551 RepID=A0A1X1CVE1_9GAMM|nr:siderophore-interacting protein [Pantoea wallisii]ORM68382.1 NADPH-dependent ferric siderophore reductase [Pantoea wallisii]